MWIITLKKKIGKTGKRHKTIHWLTGRTNKELEWAIKQVLCTYNKTPNKKEDFRILKYKLLSDEPID